MQVEKLKTIDADTLLSTPMNKTLFVVDGLIPQGLSVLSGSSKIGKSWLMLWLGIQVASGQPVWEFETHKSDVLYLCLEDTYARIQSRLYKITDEAPAELRIATTSFQIGNGLEQQIEQYLTDFPQTKLVIIALLRRSAGRSIAGRVKLPLPIIRSKYRRSQPASESCGGRLPPVLTLRWTARWCRIRCKGRRIGGKTRPVKEYIAAPIDFSFFLI